MTTEVSLYRRAFLTGVGTSLLTACVQSRQQHFSASAAIADLEIEVGGRVGVAALDTSNGAHLSHRGDERFAMCSTFKWTLAAAVLAKVDRGEIALDQPVRYNARDLLSNSPVTTLHASEGMISVNSLCESTVEVSDNTAANLLLSLIGGPAGLTSYLRKQGDHVTRLDRNEISLNSNLPGDVRDTTTPNSMVSAMHKILVDDALSAASRNRLLDWLKNCRTGLSRIRAGFPADWQAGDKTGTGANGAVNDVAIVWPPNRPPILIAVYVSESQASVETLNTVHARIGAIIATHFV
jgi:beta-lactamase class A